MKKKFLSIMVFILMVSFSGVAQGGELDDLRKEIKQLRQDYETKIQELQEKVEKLSPKTL